MSASATLAGGLAGELAGGDTASVVAGGQGVRIRPRTTIWAAWQRVPGWGSGWVTRLTVIRPVKQPRWRCGERRLRRIGRTSRNGGAGRLPAAAQVTAAIGGGANSLIQYAVNGQINYTDALIASWVGAAT